MDEVTKSTAALKLAADHSSRDSKDEVTDPLAFMPALSPGRAPYHNHLKKMTFEETVADIKSHPLFMTELDPDATENSDELAALQALAYEGTPLENAANFKDQGNECFRERRWADAREFYAKGIAVLVVEEQRRKLRAKMGADKVPAPAAAAGPGEVQLEGKDEGENDNDPEEIRKQRVLLEQLYGNRAACHLELRNYRSCTLDCAGALRLNPSNVKALYRSAKALLAVGRIAEADDACARGLEVDPDNAALRAVAKDIIAQSEAETAKRRAEAERVETARRHELLRRAALKARNIATRATGKPPEMEDARIQLVPDPGDPTSALSFPTLLLYPADLETDFIKAFNETETLDQHFGYVFPLPWDREGVYSPNGVECYMETTTGGLIKVGRKVSLLKVLSTGSVEVVDELVKIFVLPKAKAEGWVKDFKARKAAEKGGK
ncbi:hypothetical protein B0H63DRAFT_464929 [Podospora didyma]|uniref:Cns1/TTC4 wheel domain-containing protein n=1 Tax=Podospora didyma TaxID=330526 RepID=A0AAE0NYT6_9PEZI|nr:hypothetical protein B0H63DRAFT_464929 [Podospora didyma]